MRYTGPRLKVMRALGTELPGLSRKSIENRPNPPGQHGGKLFATRKSEFGKQLREKQKLKFNYGLSERQMRRLMAEARSARGNTGAAMLELLERRLDNFVFRAGFAPTLIAARQLVNHNHVLLNGRAANISSIRIRVGDEISIRDKARKIPSVIEALAAPALERPEWLAFDEAKQSARVTRLPMPDEVPFPIEIQQVIEYYTQRM
ncbi:MAG: 30S ribosomal protein S4 [Burkholderiales bacterium]|nr:30S ribosomal protein S4 [Burkholderiales bacterium]